MRSVRVKEASDLYQGQEGLRCAALLSFSSQFAPLLTVRHIQGLCAADGDVVGSTPKGVGTGRNRLKQGDLTLLQVRGRKETSWRRGVLH